MEQPPEGVHLVCRTQTVGGVKVSVSRNGLCPSPLVGVSVYDDAVSQVGWACGRPVARGRDIGYTGFSACMKMVLIACPECDRDYWVMARNIACGRKKSPICGSCSRSFFGTGEFNNNWKGGRTVSRGYVLVYVSPDDPFRSMGSSSNGRVPEHRLIMARHLGRVLETWEIVHHINGVREDNRIENLELISGATNHHCFNLLQREYYTLKRKYDSAICRLEAYGIATG